MSVMRACPECGCDVPADAPRGLCPRCLMGAAAESTAAHPRRDVAAGSKPAATLNLDEFRRAVLELKLTDALALDRIGASEPASLARALVQSHLLTPYQAGAILGGKGRGLLIGRYLVLDRLGVGGMGVVFKAQDRADRNQRVVALKILPPSFGRDADAVARFRREFEVAAHLSHPNIVAAIEAAEDRGVQFLTMEYIAGHNLETLVRDGGSLPIKLALHCVIQAARGLEAAHSQRVVHRDIKPANLMLDETGNVRVLDLGLARVIESTSALGRSLRGTLTQTGATMGTVDFLAPEQANDAKSADHRADIYSLGCTLYFLLAGRPPFPGDTLLKKLMAHQERPAPPLQTVRPEVSDALETTYQAMMAKRPADRPQSMTEVIERLEACRTTPREAGDASADLKTFARTVMKRAQPKGKIRDTSVFARSHRPGSLQIGEGVDLEDLVSDYRDEAGHDEIAEEKLPPRPVPLVKPRRERRSSVPWPLIGIATAAALVIGAVLWLAVGRSREDRSGLPTTIPTTSRPAPRRDPAPPEDAGRPLFAGSSLNDWRSWGELSENWELKGGVLASRPHKGGATFIATKQAYEDFVLTLEFQPEGPANGGLMLMTDGAKPDDPNCFEALDIKGRRTGQSFLWGDGGRFRQVKVPEVEFDSKRPWNAVTLERRDGRVTLEVNGRKIHDRYAFPRGPRWIGFQNYPGTGRVQYRNASIRELTSAGSLAARSAAFVDDFNDPKSGWSAQTAEQRSSHAEEHHGYVDGVYQIDANKDRTWWMWNSPRRPPEEFTCEVVGRVYGDNPLAYGSLALVVSGPGPSFQVKISTAGELIYLRPKKDDASPPVSRLAGTYIHPAIKTGPKAFNTITLHMKKRKAYVLVNGEMLGPPIALDHDATPAGLALGVDCKTSNVRAEFDRISFRDLDEAAVAGLEARSPAPESVQLGKILYVDDFGDPKSGWDTKPWDMGRGAKPNLKGYENGRYYLLAQENWQGSWSTGNLTGPIGQDFQVEINGRVLGDIPETPGAWGTIISRGDSRGIHVYLDRARQLWLAPSFWGVQKFPNDRSIGPITHPAIRPGDQFNTMTVRVRGRQVEVLVNHTPVLGPITLDWDLLPAMGNLTLSKPDLGVRIRNEFDRVEVRELLPPTAP